MKIDDPGYTYHYDFFSKKWCSMSNKKGDCAKSSCPFHRPEGSCSHPYHPKNMPLEAVVFAEL